MKRNQALNEYIEKGDESKLQEYAEAEREYGEVDDPYFKKGLKKTLEIYKDTRMPPPTSIEGVIIDFGKWLWGKLIKEARAMEDNKPLIPEINEIQNYNNQTYKK